MILLSLLNMAYVRHIWNMPISQTLWTKVDACHDQVSEYNVQRKDRITEYGDENRRRPFAEVHSVTAVPHKDIVQGSPLEYEDKGDGSVHEDRYCKRPRVALDHRAVCSIGV